MTAGPAAPVRTVVLSLGSNLGDRLAHLQRGLTMLCGGGLSCLAVSSVYQTDPVGGPEQDDYLNAVLLAASSLPAREILARCQAAEAAAGRLRTVHWGPRTLDVDVIACGTEISAEPVLTLPHPRAHERAFVLAPWLELAPDAELPGYGPVARLPAAAQRTGIRRLPRLRLVLPRRGPAGGKPVKLTRPGTLAAIFAVCALAAWLVVRATYENLPLLPVTAIPALAGLAIAETFVGRNVRGRLTGKRPGKPVAPLAVARLVALAKASSAAAAALGGLAAGYLSYVLGLLDKTVPARDARVAGATLAAALALLAAAIYLERSCRDPNPPDDDGDQGTDSRDNWTWHS